MSGSYSDPWKKIDAQIELQRGHGSLISGSASIRAEFHSFPGLRDEIHDTRVDDLWERMYIHPKPVILVCGACKSHNAISNPTCVQCGAPMGWSKERVYE